MSPAARAAAIDSQLSRFRRASVTVDDLSAEGASIDVAYEGTRERRLLATYMGESGFATETFYFDSTLFRVVRRTYRYDVPMSGKVVDSTMEAFDLAEATVPPARRDSLSAVARALLQRLPSQ